MQEERMQVLKMVDEGKITVDEAAKLLETLKGGSDAGRQFEEKFKDFAQDMKEFCKDVTCKINEMTKKAEPKVKEFAKTVVTKTAEVADNISQTLNEKIKDMDEGCCEEACCDADKPADNGLRPAKEEKKETPKKK